MIYGSSMVDMGGLRVMLCDDEGQLLSVFLYEVNVFPISPVEPESQPTQCIWTILPLPPGKTCHY
jgi:hypothetical protein